jgi:hypothetical protein
METPHIFVSVIGVCSGRQIEHSIPHRQTSGHPPITITRNAEPRGKCEPKVISNRDLQAFACVFNTTEITTLNEI